MKLSRASIALLLVQLAIVSSIAGKYLYQRWTCPRAWTRAVAYDPELVMRGRYISAQIYVDSCGISFPGTVPYTKSQLGKERLFHRDGVAIYYADGKIGVRENKLSVLNLVDEQDVQADNLGLGIRDESPCADAYLTRPVDFYLSETAKSPFPLASGQELWVEVTVPPKGPPRPLALALKSADGKWQPLNYQ